MNRVPKRHNPSMRDTPKQLMAPVCGKPHLALCRLCMPEILWLHPRIRNVTPR